MGFASDLDNFTLRLPWALGKRISFPCGTLLDGGCRPSLNAGAGAEVAGFTDGWQNVILRAKTKHCKIITDGRFSRRAIFLGASCCTCRRVLFEPGPAGESVPVVGCCLEPARTICRGADRGLTFVSRRRLLDGRAGSGRVCAVTRARSLWRFSVGGFEGGLRRRKFIEGRAFGGGDRARRGFR